MVVSIRIRLFGILPATHRLGQLQLVLHLALYGHLETVLLSVCYSNWCSRWCYHLWNNSVCSCCRLVVLVLLLLSALQAALWILISNSCFNRNCITYGHNENHDFVYGTVRRLKSLYIYRFVSTYYLHTASIQCRLIKLCIVVRHCKFEGHLKYGSVCFDNLLSVYVHIYALPPLFLFSEDQC